MKEIRVCAVDIGGGSTRGLLGCFDGERLTLRESGRFSSNVINLGRAAYWNFGSLFDNVTRVIGEAQKDGAIDCVGIDSFGGTTCFIDREGRLLENPTYGRDPNMSRWISQAEPLLSVEELSGAAGYKMSAEYRQFLKLRYLTYFRRGLASEIDKILFLPSALNYYLTGSVYAEHSYAVTLQFCNYTEPVWQYEAMKLAGIERDQLPQILPSGTILGSMLPNICEMTGLRACRIAAVTEHDSASAMSILAEEGMDCIFLNQGTMAVLSAPVKEPVLTDDFIMSGCGNELSYGGTIRLTRNHGGLWLVQQCRNYWNHAGLCTDYSYLEQEAARAEAGKFLFDVDDPKLRVPGNTPGMISERCGKMLSQGETIRAIYDSLAHTYLKTIHSFAEASGQTYRRIRALGGGHNSALLSQIIADTTGLPVISGPAEATALGNICVQLITSGAVGSMTEASELLSRTDAYKMYEPRI